MRDRPSSRARPPSIERYDIRRRQAKARRLSRRRCRKPITARRSARHEAVPAARIVDDVGAIEGRAQHGGVRHLAAIAAADAALVDRRHRIVAQRIVELLHRQRRAAREAHAGVVAGADILVDAEALASPCACRPSPPCRSSGFSRRCLFSMHSDEATMTFGPFSSVVSASFSVSRILATS